MIAGGVRLFHTVRFLKPQQVYGRVLFRLRRPRPDLSPAPATRAPAAPLVVGPGREPSRLGPDRFRFLNREGRLDTAAAWNDPAQEKLWLYNLHYFDWLRATEADATLEAALLDRWVQENPPGTGNGWEPYPSSLRIVNWIRWHLARAPLPPAAVHSLAVQTRYLTGRLEHHLLGNHLLENAKALVFAGLFFDGAEADAWYRQGAAILDRELREQVLPDGAHFELSPMYHGTILEDVLDLAAIHQAYGRRLPPDWAGRIPTMLRWLRAMLHPDGQIPLFSDSAFGIAPHPAALEAYAAALGHGQPEAAFPPALHLDGSGHARLASGPWLVLADIGAVGPDYLPGHAHADTLTFEASVGTARFFVDTGTSVYGTGPERLRQRATPAHNTVCVDGADSSEVWGGFRVARRARITAARVWEEAGAAIAEASHDGYRRLPGRPSHTRRWSVRDAALVVEDQLTGGGTHQATVSFHLHPGVVASQTGPETVLLSHGGQTVVGALDPGLRWRLEPTTYHPGFGLSVPTLKLLGEWQGSLQARWTNRFQVVQPASGP